MRMRNGNSPPNTVFCLASYFKGNDFMRECKRLGHRVFLLTREVKLKEDWARESLDGIFPVSNVGTIDSYLCAAAEIALTHKPTHIIALEEGDVITAGRLREHFGLPGMVGSHSLLFRDKLAMRHKAEQSRITQAKFVHLLNYQEIAEFMESVAAPWVLKPRADASAIGIKKLDDPEDVWRILDRLNQNQHLSERGDAYLLEEFIEGEVYHVDSLVNDGKVAFCCASRYGHEPLEIAVHGGVFNSFTIEHGSEEYGPLIAANERLLDAFGFKKGTTHAEFIRSRKNGEFYFIEIGSRVGGAFTAEAVEAASGLNIWREWARMEMSPDRRPYIPKPIRSDHAGFIVTLARQEYPDTSAYTDPEIFCRPKKESHAALVLRSASAARVRELLREYTRRFENDFLATAPQPDRPD